MKIPFLSLTRRRLVGVVFGLSSLLCAIPSSALEWHYDFDTTDDLSALAVVNPSGLPNHSLTDTPGTLQMNMPVRSGGFYNGFDLASWTNRDALRLYRLGGNEAFVLETSLSSSSAGFTYLSGIYLYSNDGSHANDLLFGATPTHLKIELGEPTIHSDPFEWTLIGAYTTLYLQVEYDGISTLHFRYRTSTSEDWTLYKTFGGYFFDHVGLITKTWSEPSQASPAVTANFDYLYYNYTPRWTRAYAVLFDNPRDLRLLRDYRDEVLRQDKAGAALLRRLYDQSDALLLTLLADPDLLREAKALLGKNMQAVRVALSGDEGTVLQSRRLVRLLDALAQQSPPELRSVITQIKRQVVLSRSRGDSYLGFRFE